MHVGYVKLDGQQIVHRILVNILQQHIVYALVYAKNSVMALTPPLSVIMTLIIGQVLIRHDAQLHVHARTYGFPGARAQGRV